MQDFLKQQEDIDLVGVTYNGEEILEIIEEKRTDVVCRYYHASSRWDGVLEHLNVSKLKKA